MDDSEKTRQFYAEYDKLSKKEKLRRFDKRIEEADAKRAKRYNDSKPEWEIIEKELKKVIDRPWDEVLIQNICVKIAEFMRKVGNEVWSQYTDENLNLIETALQGLDLIDIDKCPTTKMGTINIFKYIVNGTYFELLYPEYTIGRYFKSDKFMNEWRAQKKEIKNKDVINDDEYTPPVSVSELAAKFSLSQSSISNKERPMGRLFHQYCQEQKVREPRLPYKELYSVVRQCTRRSKQEGADEQTIDSIDDVRRLWGI